MLDEALKISHISKSFGGVHALTDMNLIFHKGEITGLCGANGAGKSTLLNIIFGVYTQDEGSIYVEGEEIKKNSPIIAQEKGMSIIFQHRRLMQQMTIAENIFIDHMPKKKGRIDYAKMQADAQKYLDELGLDIDPKREVASLSAEDKQLIEIVKAYARNPKIFLMDEPTSALRQAGVEKMFNIMNKLKEKGAAVVFISHRLKEVLDICDTITVIKDGKFVVSKPCNLFDAKQLVNSMSGDSVSRQLAKNASVEGQSLNKNKSPENRIQQTKNLIEVKELSTKNSSKVNFVVHPGEIVGFAGLGGSGVQDVFDHLFGICPKKSGTVLMNNEEINPKNPIQAIRHSIGYVPEDRQLYGEFLEMKVRDNISVTAGQQRGYFSKIRVNEERKATEHYIDRLGIKTPSGEVNISALSGGNQQKAVIAKWLEIDADLLVLNEPTAGIDVAAKREMIEFIKELSCMGKGILYSTSYITELMDVSDRIVVIYKGKVFKEYNKEEFDSDLISLAINGIEE